MLVNSLVTDPTLSSGQLTNESSAQSLRVLVLRMPPHSLLQLGRPSLIYYVLKEGDGKGESIVVIRAAGGDGSILVQLVKQLTSLEVIATASRPETIDWVKKMGADHVINHRNSLTDQCKEKEISPKYFVGMNGTEEHMESIIELIKVRGPIAIIDDPSSLI